MCGVISRTILFCAISFCGVFASAIALAQSRSGPPAFQVETGLVRLDLQVEEHGIAVTGLGAEDFIVYDEGQQQRTLYFDVASDPVDLVLLLDLSGSMEGKTRAVAESGLNAVRMLRPEDRVALIAFTARPKLLVPLKTDRGPAIKALHRLFRRIPNDETDLYAGIDRANQVLWDTYDDRNTAGEMRRRAILIVTDNLGGFRRNEERMMGALKSTDAVVNALILDPEIDIPFHLSHARRQQDVTRITALTGGVSVETKARSGLPAMLPLIQTRYSLYYRRPDALPGAYRQVEVALAPGMLQLHPEARITVRPGYSLP
jgi:VWFA-related protein